MKTMRGLFDYDRWLHMSYPLMVILLLASCSPKVVGGGGTHVSADTVVILSVQHDTIIQKQQDIVKDYVYVKEKGDTVFITRYRYERDYSYEKILQQRIDSMSRVEADTVYEMVVQEVQKPLTAGEKIWIRLGKSLSGLFLFFALVFAGWRIIKNRLT